MKEQREEGIKQYEELRKKSKEFPTLAEFEEEFEVRIQSPAIALIINILADKMMQAVGHIEILFQPTRIADMIECKFHDENEKKELFELYKKTISLIHEIGVATYENREARIKAMIKSLTFYKKELKPRMKAYLEKQAKGWLEQEKPEPKKDQYFG